jgi:hypothetical protein
MLAMGEHGGDEGFTWFRPSECNNIRPRENDSCIVVCSSSIGLTLGCLGFSLSILTSVAIIYSSRLQWLHCGPRVVGPYTVAAP